MVHNIVVLAILVPLFRITRYIFVKLQSLIWLLNGTHQVQVLSRTEEGYSSCVHVQDIWLRCSTQLVQAQKENFLTVHHCFTNPKVLLADNVSLYTLTPTEAIFVKTDPTVNLYHSNTSAFLKNGQYKYATQVLSMPLQA